MGVKGIATAGKGVLLAEDCETWGSMRFSGGEVDSENGVRGLKVIDFINVPPSCFVPGLLGF